MLTRKSLLLTLSCISLSMVVPLAAAGQGIGEYGGLNAGMAGLGAGLAASLNHGAVVRRAYESTIEAQQALLAQNKAVEQYYKLGNQFELKKQWENAEKAFHYVVQVIAKRDGPGSPKSVPALKHLVAICQNQNKLDMAISYQKTVLTFTKGVKVPDPKVLIQETGRLSDLFIRKSDYVSAAPLLHDEVALCKQTPVAPAEYQRTLKVYGSVLRHLDRLDEAKKVDDLLVSLSAEAKPLDNTAEVKSAEVKTPDTVPTATGTGKSAIPSILSSEDDASPSVSDKTAEAKPEAAKATASSSGEPASIAPAITSATPVATPAAQTTAQSQSATLSPSQSPAQSAAETAAEPGAIPVSAPAGDSSGTSVDASLGVSTSAQSSTAATAPQAQATTEQASTSESSQSAQVPANNSAEPRTQESDSDKSKSEQPPAHTK